jgi:hypothetical protein
MVFEKVSNRTTAFVTFQDNVAERLLAAISPSPESHENQAENDSKI